MAPCDSAVVPRDDEKHEEVDGDDDRRRNDEPVGDAEGGHYQNEVDEIAAGDGVGDLRELRLGLRRDRRVERTLLRSHHRPAIDVPGRDAGEDDGGDAAPERPEAAGPEPEAERHAREDRDVDDVVAPEVEDAAVARLLELQPGELGVASVDDRVEQEQDSAPDLDGRPCGEEERRAGDADPDGDQRHLIGSDAGTGELPRDGERDRPVEVLRHEAFFVLDEAAEQVALGARKVRGRRCGDADRRFARRELLQVLDVDDDVPRKAHRAGRRGVDELRPGSRKSGLERLGGANDLYPREARARRREHRAAGERQAEERRLRRNPGSRGWNEGEDRSRRHRLVLAPGPTALSADNGSPPRRCDSFARARTLAHRAASARLWPRTRGLSASAKNSVMTPANQSAWCEPSVNEGKVHTSSVRAPSTSRSERRPPSRRSLPRVPESSTRFARSSAAHVRKISADAAGW